MNYRDLQRQQQWQQRQVQALQYSAPIPTQQQQEGEAGDDSSDFALGDAAGDGASGGVTQEDLAKVMGALKKEREQASTYAKELKRMQAQLKAFEGIDPERAKEAEKILQQQQQIEEEQAKFKASLEAKFRDQYEPMVKAANDQIRASQQALIDFQRDSLLERSFYEAGGFPGEYADVAHKLRGRVKVDLPYDQLVQLMQSNPSAIADHIQVLKKDGTLDYTQPRGGEAKPKSLGDLVNEMKQEDISFARHFQALERGGMGIEGSARNYGQDLSNLGPWERVAALRARNGKA